MPTVFILQNILFWDIIWFMNKPTLIDLFCGAGGLSHGFAQAGFSVLAGLDHDDDSLITFEANHRNSRAMNVDLAKARSEIVAQELGIKSGAVDCIVGGPPCQGFSKNRAFRHQNGVYVDDARNYLYQSFFKYVAFFRPKVVVIENVPELLIKADGTFRDAISENFVKLGYNCDAKVVNASEFGVPQVRKRAIFIAGREGQKVPFPQPTTRPGKRPGQRTPSSRNKPQQLLLVNESGLPVGPSVWDAISDLYGKYADDLHGESVYTTEPCSLYQHDRRRNQETVRNHFPWKLTDRQLQRIRLLKEGQGQLHLPPELQTKNGYGSAYRRLQSDAQALTLTTWMFHPGSGMFTHPFADRVLTIREAGRIQSFQDSFTFSGSYHSQCRQIGNSVAPLMAQELAKAILAVLH